MLPQRRIGGNRTPNRHDSQESERWQSGRMYLTRNQAYVQAYRGFESHPLRQLSTTPPCGALCFLRCASGVASAGSPPASGRQGRHGTQAGAAVRRRFITRRMPWVAAPWRGAAVPFGSRSATAPRMRRRTRRRRAHPRSCAAPSPAAAPWPRSLAAAGAWRSRCPCRCRPDRRRRRPSDCCCSATIARLAAISNSPACAQAVRPKARRTCCR